MTATPTPIRPAGYGPRPSFGPHSVIVTVGEFVLVPVPREAVDLARQTADALAELTDARARFTRALEAGEPRERLRGEVDRLELVELLEVAGAWFGGLLVATMATVGAYAWMIGAGR